MTTESGPWLRQIDQPRPQQTKTHDTAPNTDDVKRVLKIRNIFGQMLQTATAPRGLTAMPGPMEGYDFEKRVFKVGKNIADYGKAALFADGLWLVATTRDDEGLTSARHELKIYHHDAVIDHPDIYQITPLQLDGEPDPVDRYMEGVEQIAAGIDLYEFGQIVRAYDTQAAKGWPGKLSREEAAYARIQIKKTL